MKKGKFIVIDGPEGAGKSSLIKELKKKYGEKIMVTREPGGSPYAEEIRNLILNSEGASQADAKTMFALFWAARADHIKNTIVPAIKKGIHVISDRFDSSTFAYQIYGQQARELENFFFSARDFFLQNVKPDYYIYVDVDVETGLQRKQNVNVEINHFDQKKIDFYERMRNGFDVFFKQVSSEIRIIDANPPFELVLKNLETEIENIISG